MWMAPNLITLIGTAFIFFAFIAAVFYSPDLAVPVPPIVNIIFAVSLWTYSTLDNVDGKQARRTGSSSPLGELFDHGCDSLVTGMGCVMQLASLGMARQPFGLVTIFLAFSAFYLPTWEEYHTGVLYLGYVNGPTEGIIAFCAMYLITGLFGVEVWKTRVYGEWSIEDCLGTFFIAAFFLFALPSSLWNVYRASRAKREPFIRSIMTLTPFASITMCVGLLIVKYDLPNTDYYAVFLSLLTVLFGRMATSVIYAHLLNLPYPSLPTICLPLWMAPMAFRLLGNQRAAVVLKPFFVLYFVVACVEYANWVYHTVLSFTRFLNIQCFSLKKPAIAASNRMVSSPSKNKLVKPTFADIVKSAPLKVN